jgi:uncharacterized protein (DUF433 family)
VASVQKSLRIRRETLRAIEQLGSEEGLDFSATANQLLEEAVRMRRCPGIVFTQGPSGRRATVAGTGLDVWEIIATYHRLGHSESRLHKAYDRLTEPQLRAALAYYAQYPEEVDARLQREASLSPAWLERHHPALVAPGRRKPRR